MVKEFIKGKVRRKRNSRRERYNVNQYMGLFPISNPSAFTQRYGNVVFHANVHVNNVPFTTAEYLSQSNAWPLQPNSASLSSQKYGELPTSLVLIAIKIFKALNPIA